MQNRVDQAVISSRTHCDRLQGFEAFASPIELLSQPASVKQPGHERLRTPGNLSKAHFARSTVNVLNQFLQQIEIWTAAIRDVRSAQE